MNTPPDDQDEGLDQRFERLVRVGELGQLAALLEKMPALPTDPVVSYWRGRLAIARAEYEHASKLFQEAATVARKQSNTLIHQSSLTWLAYCHTILGNYSLASTLVDGVARVIATDDPVYAWILFIRGLLAAEKATMAEAQEWFEQARDLALQLQDTWLEARCCTNLAVVCMSQGLMDRSGRMIQRVEKINSEGVSSPQQLMQVRNIEVYRLRLMGELERALQVALPLPEESDDGSRHYRGWLALTTATVAIDLDKFDLAEEAWQRAAFLIEPVQDSDISIAELLWERAWLRFRQGRLDDAYQEIHRALNLVESQIDNEHFHALAIAAIIDLARDDLAFVGRNLREVSNHFRSTKHYVGLVSVLMHVAAYHLRGARPKEARLAIIEGFTLMREHRLHGMYYWHPATMVTLCTLAIEEDWGDLDESLTISPQVPGNTLLPEILYLETHPKDALGDFAASLAVHRLAVNYWENFAPLLTDPRPQVRRRCAQVLRASNNDRAITVLEKLRNDPEPYLKEWYTQHILPQRGPAIIIHSFGRFELLVNNEPLKLRNAGSQKAKAVFGVLLLAGEQGIESRDLALLLWPEQEESKRRPSLQTTISVLRRALKGALGDDRVITFNTDNRRYSLQVREGGIWWDWDRLRQIAQTVQLTGGEERLFDEAKVLYREGFMDDFLAMLPKPNLLHDGMEMWWNSLHDTLLELVEEHEAKATAWMHELRTSIDDR